MKYIPWIVVSFWIIILFGDVATVCFNSIRERAVRRRGKKNTEEVKKGDEEGIFD